ncbi:MAG: cytochrome c1 [Betaproteobacteria bacterium]|jgi:Cytochrome c1|nr:cytochrome c1 [Betaproteobacteria bacterium]
MTISSILLRWTVAFFLALSLGTSCAVAEDEVKLDRAPVDSSNLPSLQRGAQHFMNYCMTCHSAHLARFDLLEQLGLSDKQVKQNLILTDAKLADYMTVVLNNKDAKNWFGVPPPDLSVEARVRGADWLYTYLRSFYRDDQRPNGWNNLIFPNVAMPDVLWQLQGQQILQSQGGAGHLVLIQRGKMSAQEYDQFVGDLVNFLVFLSEPSRATRLHIGVWVLGFLVVLFFIARALKHEFWKDIH